MDGQDAIRPAVGVIRRGSPRGGDGVGAGVFPRGAADRDGREHVGPLPINQAADREGQGGIGGRRFRKDLRLALRHNRERGGVDDQRLGHGSGRLIEIVPGLRGRDRGRARTQDLDFPVHHEGHRRIGGRVGDVQALAGCRPGRKSRGPVGLAGQRPEKNLLRPFGHRTRGRAQRAVGAAGIRSGDLHLQIFAHFRGSNRKTPAGDGGVGPGTGRASGNPPLVNKGERRVGRAPGSRGNGQGFIHPHRPADGGQHAVRGCQRQHHGRRQGGRRGGSIGVGGSDFHPQEVSDIVR